MKLDEAIYYFDNCTVPFLDHKDYRQIYRWLSELKELRKSKLKKPLMSYTVTFWCNAPEVTHELNVLGRSAKDAIRRYSKMFPKMHPVGARLTRE